MPTIIDQVKIGQLIKQLLKKHNMTQDQLAQHLHITKSAVSQNLNGKSTFDIQNLIAISKLFDITLDDLLSLSDSNQSIKSKYELLVDKGLESISNVSPSQLLIHTPDMYGYVLIEYVMKAKNFPMFDYLLEHSIPYVERTYHRAVEVTVLMLNFMLEHERPYINTILDDLVTLEHQFIIREDKLENIFFNLLDQEKNKATRQFLIQKTLTQPSFSFKKQKLEYKLNKSLLINHIGKYHLKNLLKDVLLETNLEPQIYPLTKACLSHQFYKGIELALDHLFQENPNGMKQVLYQVQEVALLIVKTKQPTLIKKMIEKDIYVNITQIFEEILELKDASLIQYTIEKCHNFIHFDKLNIQSLHDDIALSNIILPYLNQKNKNIILSKLNKHHLKLMIHLIQHGAQFDLQYYTQETFETINSLMEHLIIKESKHE